MEAMRTVRLVAAGVGLLSVLNPQPALATAVFECPGVRYLNTSSVAVPDPANTASTCRTTYDGGTVTADATFNAVTAFGSAGWSLTAGLFGQVLRVTNGLGITWNLGPLPGRLVAITDPAVQTTYTYNSLNQIQSTTAPGSQVTTYSYDASDRIATTVSPTGNVTTYTYDAMGRPDTASETAGGGHTITYTYDALSTRPATAVESPGGHTLTYSYNAMGQLSTRVDSTGPATTTYTYDPAFRLEKIDDAPSAHTTRYEYDAGDRLIKVTQDPPPPAVITEYQYDAMDRVSEVERDGTLITRFEYDAVGHLTRDIQDPGGANERITRFEYDALGRLSHIIDPFGLQTDFTYVPAPGTLLLLALGLTAFGFGRRRACRMPES